MTTITRRRIRDAMSAVRRHRAMERASNPEFELHAMVEGTTPDSKYNVLYAQSPKRRYLILRTKNDESFCQRVSEILAGRRMIRKDKQCLPQS